MILRLLSAAISAAVFASCAPSTPEARIAVDPSLFEALPARHQELVRQGRIEKGMGTNVVLIAWGRPSREYEGSDGNVATLRWDYHGSSPVYGTNFYGSYGYGRYGRYQYDIGPQVTYVPYRRASVLFRDGRVNSWEKSR